MRWIGAGIAAAMVILVTAAVIEELRRVNGFPPPPLALALSAFDIIVFAILVGAALYYRKRPDWHKRLILSATIVLLGAPMFRAVVHSLGGSDMAKVSIVSTLMVDAFFGRLSGGIAGDGARLYGVRWQTAATPAQTAAPQSAVVDLSLAREAARRKNSPNRVALTGLSFRDKAGDYCRTFSLAGPAASSGLACHEGADWRIKALAQSAQVAANSGNFRTAASEDSPAIRAAVEGSIDGEALDHAGEISAREAGWAAASKR
jgi:hypothetical protein